LKFGTPYFSRNGDTKPYYLKIETTTLFTDNEDLRVGKRIKAVFLVLAFLGKNLFFMLLTF